MERVVCNYTKNITKKTSRLIEYIVIHYTAGLSSIKGKALSTAKYFGTSATASADFIVDDETIVQYNSDIDNQYTWHCGGKKLSSSGILYGICKNSNSIGIEVCSNNSTNKVQNANEEGWYFTQESLDNTLILVKELMETYNIDEAHVIRHYDVTGKLCPGIIGWTGDNAEEWERFKNEIVGEDELSLLKKENEQLRIENEKYKSLIVGLKGLLENY